MICNTIIDSFVLDSQVKDYPPEEHALSHDSNPLAAGLSLVRQKIKDDAVQSNTKPTQVLILSRNIYGLFTVV